MIGRSSRLRCPRRLALFALLLLLPACGGGGGGGQHFEWRVKPGELPVAVDEESFKEYNRLAAKNDQVHIQQLMLRGKLFSIRQHTEVEVIDRDIEKANIKVQNGPQAGKTGWIQSDQIEHVLVPDK